MHDDIAVDIEFRRLGLHWTWSASRVRASYSRAVQQYQLDQKDRAAWDRALAFAHAKEREEHAVLSAGPGWVYVDHHGLLLHEEEALRAYDTSGLDEEDLAPWPGEEIDLEALEGLLIDDEGGDTAEAWEEAPTHVPEVRRGSEPLDPFQYFALGAVAMIALFVITNVMLGRM